MAQSRFLKVALEAVKKAEKIILKYYPDDIRATLKPDQTPVTLVDVQAEQIIKETIKKQFPDHGFRGEELGKDNDQSDYLWIIDPIDGTKNYTRKIFTFGTELALTQNGEFIVGVSNAPILKELVYAEKNCGAYCNKQEIHVSKVDCLSEAHFSFGGIRYFAKNNLVPELLDLASKVRSTRSFGDFWAFHLLAQGKIDIVVEAEVKICDVAALKVIVEKAGGKITDIYGLPVNLETTTIVATNGKLHSEVLKFFQV